MAAVEAIKDIRDVKRVADLLTKHYGTHYSDLWLLGCNLALRITDLLNLKINQCQEALINGNLRVKEGKTQKYRSILLNLTAQKVLRERIEAEAGDVYLFQSHSNRTKSIVKPLSRQAVWKAFKAVGDIVGVSMGTHTMRKTRGCVLYENGVPIEQIAKVLNHSSPAVTMVYLGITQGEIDDTYRKFEIY